MSEATWYTGDALEVMRTLPDDSVDLCIFSPPFLALRSYLPADHDDKHREMGSEATPGEFVDGLMLIVEECRRVLAPHGSLCIELGDTFAGSGGAGGDYNDNGLREGQPKFKQGPQPDDTDKQSEMAERRRSFRTQPQWGSNMVGGRGWPLAKSLSMVPELVRITMAYGRNPLTGRETGQWRIRNVIRWVRPNPPVGALGDKFRPATSEMLVACVSPKRFFDLDAVRTEHARDYTNETPTKANSEFDRTGAGRQTTVRESVADPAGAPPLDWWNIPTQPYKGSHYATWPKALVLKPIKAMCPEKVCNVCGVPSTRIVNAQRRNEADDSTRDKNHADEHPNLGDGYSPPPEVGWEYDRETVGWTDCGHNDWRRGVVLDPFAGSGTTLEVATGLGRDAIGIDLDERNLELARRRVGMFLTEANLNRHTQ